MVDATVVTRKSVELRGGRFVAELEDRPTLVVRDEPLLVGRDGACHLSLKDKSVSAVHAELVATPRGVHVRDLGSKNGVWIGDLAVVEGYLIGPESLWVGEVELAFEPLAPETRALPTREIVGGLYGRSASMREVFRRIAQASPTDLTVLVQGETGTGKELVARAIHAGSARAKEPFVVIDCGAISPGLAEATLFGHERGAFTGASRDRPSPFVEAGKGTVFLDELGELPLDLQPKLLRALAERRVKRVGSNVYEPFVARVVAATRRDLPKAVSSGEFRNDLYFRVAEVRIDVPPLRERADDIPGILRHVFTELGDSSAWRRVGRAALDKLLRYPWPGNVRELRSAAAAALALAPPKGPLDVAAEAGLDRSASGLAAELTVRRGAGRSYHDARRAALGQFERAYFGRLVEETGGNVAEMSRRAGLQRTHVRRYLQEHGLRTPKAT